MKLKLAIMFLALGVAAHVQAGETLRFNYDFTENQRGEEWTGDFYEVPGLPRVPKRTARILIPYGKQVDHVEFLVKVAEVKKEKMGWETTPHPRPLCDVEFREPSVGPFSEEEFFPEDHTGPVEEVVKHGYRIAYIDLFPVLFNPRGGYGFRVPRGELVIHLKDEKRGARAVYRANLRDRQEALELADEIDQVASYPTLRSTRSTAEYLVIGPKNLVQDGSSSIYRLLFEKGSRGITSRVLTNEEIESSFPGANFQEKARNAVKKYYQDGGTRYLLLVGNGYSITPTKILTVPQSEGNLPSDLYFGCLDGNFSAKPYDMACEVVVGRAPVSNSAELDIFVRKNIQLQDVAPADPLVWKTLNFGEKLDGSTYASSSLKMLVNGGTGGSGISTQGYPASAQFSTLYESSQKIFKGTEVITSLSAEPFYTVNHLGHCNTTYCLRLESSALNQVKSPFPYFGFTQGCFPGNIRKENWATQMVLQPDGGAGAYVANSNYGWYQPGSSGDGPSNRLHTLFYDTVFKEGYREIGRALYRAKERLIPQANANTTMRWVVYETNLFGDPEISFKFP